MKVKYLIVFVSSVLLLLTTYWSYGYYESAGWVGCACYFALTVLFLRHYDDGRHVFEFTGCILLGRLLPELPFRALYYANTRSSIIVTIITVAAIVLAATYHRNRSDAVLILSVVIMILLNTLGYNTWEMLLGH